jgi:hypothetical protein
VASRVVKSERDHVITIKLDRGGYLRLVPGGPRRAYLWFGDAPADGSRPAVVSFDSLSGATALRALAKAILKEIRP